MADTSPHDTHRQPGSGGMPGEIADRRPANSDALLLDTDVAEATLLAMPADECWRLARTPPP